MEDARQRVTRWIEEAPGFVEMVGQVVDDRQRALAAVADTERQCAELREALAAVRAECDDLKRDRSETGAMLAEVLGRAGEALLRLRPSADVRVASPVPAPPPPSVPSTIEVPGRLAEPPALPTPTFAAPRPMDPIETLAAPSASDPVEAVAEVGAVEMMESPAARAPEPIEVALESRASAPIEPAAERSARPAEPGEGGATWHVLLVDDDQNFRNVMTEYLEGIRGYGVRVAASGEEGLSMLEHYQPDIVLLDLMMPGMGGMAALQSMKTLYPSLCVVMVTANEDLSLARRALSLGAADYVTKPFDLDYLDALLNMYLTKDEPASEEPAPAASVSPSLEAIPEQIPAPGEEREVSACAAAVDEPGPVLSAARSLRSYFARR